MITFISGGARSGKSRVAESLAYDSWMKKKEAGETASLSYLATSRPIDSEMKERIDRHKKSRNLLWKTRETPIHIEETVITEGEVIVLDCLTIWLGNMLFERKAEWGDIKGNLTVLLDRVEEQQANLYLVSNDVNEGMILSDDVTSRYIQTLEEIHKVVISRSHHVIQVVSGLPVVWKGGRG